MFKKPAPTIADLAQRCPAEHVRARRKPRTVESCRWLVWKSELPELGKMVIDALERRPPFVAA